MNYIQWLTKACYFVLMCFIWANSKSITIILEKLVTLILAQAQAWVENDYFDQHLACTAPELWLKYTTNSYCTSSVLKNNNKIHI